MPQSAPHPCAVQGCPTLVPRSVARCPTHEKQRLQVSEATRGTAHERGYNKRWAKARLTYLRQHPLCVRCLAQGRTTAARVVDHVMPHRGDWKKFWDVSNWQPLCDYTSPYDCHGKKTATEDGGFGHARK
jgi:5-methylcytosine-specific restriction enzyme A